MIFLQETFNLEKKSKKNTKTEIYKVKNQNIRINKKKIFWFYSRFAL